MLCRRARDWISLSLDGMLPADRTVALTEHLERCGTCRAYREELQVGQRLLAVTTPQLSDNFEWRLQLKLNQTLQEAAREVTSPWVDATPGWPRWLRGAALSAVGGAAVFLLAASVLLPARHAGPGAPATTVASVAVEPPAPRPAVPAPVTAAPHEVATVTSTAGDPTRTALLGGLSRAIPLDGGSGRGADLSLTAAGGLFGRDGWSGGNIDDLRTILHLREQNRRLRDALAQAQNESRLIREQLESARAQRADSLAAAGR